MKRQITSLPQTGGKKYQKENRDDNVIFKLSQTRENQETVKN